MKKRLNWYVVVTVGLSLLYLGYNGVVSASTVYNCYWTESQSHPCNTCSYEGWWDGWCKCGDPRDSAHCIGPVQGNNYHTCTFSPGVGCPGPSGHWASEADCYNNVALDPDDYFPNSCVCDGTWWTYDKAVDGTGTQYCN